MTGQTDVVGLLALVQSLAYPMVRALGGPDIPTHVDDAAPVLNAVADVLKEAEETVRAAARALADGIASRAELDEVVDEAGDVAEKWAALKAAVRPSAPEVPPDTVPTLKAPPYSDGLASPEYQQPPPKP